MTRILRRLETTVGGIALMVAVVALPATTFAAQGRNPGRGGGNGGGTQAVPRSEPAPSPAPAPSPTNNGTEATPQSAPATGGTTATGNTGGQSRQGRPTNRVAIPRGSVPAPPNGGRTVVVPGYYGGYWPWGFGGLGFAGYYGGLYDPFSPWYSGYDGYGYSTSIARTGPEGSLRLKIKPRDAQVYVDGFYAGIVDDFDGTFQRLHTQAGPHHIDVRAPGYETLDFDVQIRPDQTITFERELQRTQ